MNDPSLGEFINNNSCKRQTARFGCRQPAQSDSTNVTNENQQNRYHPVKEHDAW